MSRPKGFGFLDRSTFGSTKVSAGLYVVDRAYEYIPGYFETSPLFPGEPVAETEEKSQYRDDASDSVDHRKK